MPPTERFAAIDVGSNSIRCLVAERGDDGHLSVIDDLKDQPRLARGLSSTGMLAPEAIDRAVQAIGRMLQAADRRGASKVALVATSAVRDASNGAEFAERVQRELGVPLEVIDGETEARLAFLSVREHFAVVRGRAVVMDIGGGSLELVLAASGLVDSAVSLPFGAVRLTEQYLADAGSPDAGIRRLRNAVRHRLRRTVASREWAGARLFGSGGTFTNAARVLAAREHGTVPPAVHAAVLTLGEIQRLLDWLSRLTVAERLKVEGLNPERADIIPAGLAVAAEVMEHFAEPQLTVSAYGLREGLLLHLARPQAAGDVAPSRGKALRRFGDRCRVDRRHAEQSLRLAERLFQVLGKHLGCGPEDWEVLEAAALLHDVGQLVSYRGHHKHSLHLINHAESLPLTPRQRLIVGLVARYHRRAAPSSKRHAEFAALDGAEKAQVRRLAAILRVACGLDRGHVAAVESLRLRMLPGRLLIDVTPRLVTTDLKLELWGAQRKADLLETLLEREIVVRAPTLEGPPETGEDAGNGA